MKEEDPKVLRDKLSHAKQLLLEAGRLLEIQGDQRARKVRFKILEFTKK